MAAEIKMAVKLSSLPQSLKCIFFFKFMQTLTNYRIFMELTFSQRYQMADLFKMVKIWSKIFRSCKLFLKTANLKILKGQFSKNNLPKNFALRKNSKWPID
jgi:hypothetical protein